MAEVRLTKEGVEKYEQRLEYLKTTGRTEIAEQIQIARSFGDLSENAEYDAAKLEQARMEYEIVEIEAMLRNVVKVLNKALNKEMTFQIVGSAEANPRENRISNESPVGAGLLGHKLGEVVSIATPAGTSEFEILEISK